MLSCDLVKRLIDKGANKVGRPKGSRNKSSVGLRAVPPVLYLRERANIVHKENGVMQITKKIEKQVTHPVSGAPVKRTAYVTFDVPDYTVRTVLTHEKDEKGNVVKDAKGNPKTKDIYEGLSLPNALEVFGGKAERLIAFAISGLENQIRVDQSNNLAKADKATRAISAMAKQMRKVMGDIATDDMIRSILLSNPTTEAAFSAQAENFAAEINVTVDPNDYEPRVVRPDSTSDEGEESNAGDESEAA